MRWPNSRVRRVLQRHTVLAELRSADLKKKFFSPQPMVREVLTVGA